MTSSSPHYRRLIWILPAFIIVLAFYNILRSFEIKQWWTNKLKDPTYISASFDIPGLGNLMFQYASVVGIARKSDKILVLPLNMRLCQVFELPELKRNMTRPGSDWGKVVELRHSAYDEKVDNLELDHNVEVVGYLQSWKYFESFERELKKHLIFKSHIQQQAESFLQKASSTYKTSGDGVLFIGVHVRRGDFLNEKQIKHGYTVASREYIEKAMKHFENKYSEHSVIFVVASDDMSWCKQNVASKNIIFCENYDEVVDMAILSQCNHTIMTVGTYGWWSAWLAGGDVIYFKNFPLPNSRLSNAFSKTKQDYFPTDWIGM